MRAKDFDGHAIAAAEIAPICEGDAEVSQRAAAEILRGLRHVGKEAWMCW